MDAIDLKILSLLQKNAKKTMKELSEDVHLSAPATTERVKKLEDQGYIEAYRAQINLQRMNRVIQAMVLFKTRDCKGLANFCENHSDVLTCYRVAGEISYIAHVATTSVETLEKFIDQAMFYGTPSTNIILSSSQKEVITYNTQ